MKLDSREANSKNAGYKESTKPSRQNERMLATTETRTLANKVLENKPVKLTKQDRQLRERWKPGSN